MLGKLLTAAAMAPNQLVLMLDCAGRGSGCDKVEGRLLECEAVQGLCQLLEHHVTVLEQSQSPLNSLLQPAAAEGETCKTKTKITS